MRKLLALTLVFLLCSPLACALTLPYGEGTVLSVLGLTQPQQTLVEYLYPRIFAGEAEIDLPKGTRYDDASAAMSSLMQDYPEMFHLGKNYSLRYYQHEPEIAISVTPQYRMGQTEAAALRTQLYTQAYLLVGQAENIDHLHDLLLERVTYGGSTEMRHTAVGALLDGVATCEGYAQALSLLYRMGGIPCGIISGEAVDTQGRTDRHSWNIAGIYGYTLIDATWNDQDTLGLNTHWYYGLSSDQMGADHFPDADQHIPDCGEQYNWHQIRGYVVIHQPMEIIRRNADSMLNISYMMLVILLVLSLIILLFFNEYVYRPLRRIIAAAEQYALGNMHYRIPVEREDELGYLSASLGYMAETIARSEDDQKKFIANVSHDFRSPLTSIRGFLEAMLDGTIPPERYEHYLRVVLKETDRLTKLTNGLLTLNNLNTGGMLLQRTDFDINAVIRSVAASFEQTCRSRRIDIRLILTGKMLFVNADLEKIQQVLYNLVDNALKFSRQDSDITIETTEKGDTVFVSVRDSGIGIPKDDQKLIWDRFYKTDLSRGKDKKGTGLGLSIVREIIRAHGENISLVSTQGVGSKFTFTLRRSDLNDELDDDDL